jgi:hypothetical protein
LDAFGAQGMSLDESDDDKTGIKIYILQRKVWCNKDITKPGLLIKTARQLIAMAILEQGIPLTTD